jgi:predicted dinucleotide-binding enzyme
VAIVAEIVDRIGFDAVRLDSLSAGRDFEAGGPIFGALLRRSEFDRALRPAAA